MLAFVSLAVVAPIAVSSVAVKDLYSTEPKKALAAIAVLEALPGRAEATVPHLCKAVQYRDAKVWAAAADALRTLRPELREPAIRLRERDPGILGSVINGLQNNIGRRELSQADARLLIPAIFNAVPPGVWMKQDYAFAVGEARLFCCGCRYVGPEHEKLALIYFRSTSGVLRMQAAQSMAILGKQAADPAPYLKMLKQLGVDQQENVRAAAEFALKAIEARELIKTLK